MTKQKITLGVFVILTLIFVSYQFVEKESVDRRVVLTNNAFSIIHDHPLFGVGLNNFILANHQQTIINSYQDLQPVHSMYLLFISETGIIGIALLVLFLVFIQKRAQINKTSLYFIWSLGTLLVFGLFDHYPLTIHQTLLLGSVLTGFILISKRVVKF